MQQAIAVETAAAVAVAAAAAAAEAAAAAAAAEVAAAAEAVAAAAAAEVAAAVAETVEMMVPDRVPETEEVRAHREVLQVSRKERERLQLVPMGLTGHVRSTTKSVLKWLGVRARSPLIVPRLTALIRRPLIKQPPKHD